jgi:hypothetical protein
MAGVDKTPRMMNKTEWTWIEYKGYPSGPSFQIEWDSETLYDLAMAEKGLGRLDAATNYVVRTFSGNTGLLKDVTRAEIRELLRQAFQAADEWEEGWD